MMMLSLVFTSCYPPQIIYSIADIQPPYQKDSIDVRLIEGNTIATGCTSLHLGVHLEILNNKENSILIGQNPSLELRTDSVVLKYEIFSDSLNYQLGENEKKILYLYFQVTDFDCITYKTVEWPSIWNFRTLKIKNPQHKLFLFLDLRNEEGAKIEKCIILKPTGTRRM